MISPVPFFDSRRPARPTRAEMLAAIGVVYDSGNLILGDQVTNFEREFATWCGCAHAVGVADGTDAILLTLKALDIGPGDEVIVPAQSASATAAAVAMSGASIVFCDLEPEGLTLDPVKCAACITPKTRAVVAVHLYGHSADLDALLAICAKANIALVEDCAQAHGTCYKGRQVGSFGVAGCFSFYPTKNLGALGDGGAIVTNDPDLAERLLQLRQYGWKPRFFSVVAGFNSRLDEVQAAVLRLRLAELDGYIAERRRLARLYFEQLEQLHIQLPVRDGGDAFHLFVIRCSDRDGLRQWLSERGIQTGIHYVWTLTEQPAFETATNYGNCPVAEKSAKEVLSLPMFPGLTDDEVRRVCVAVAEWSAAKGHAR